MLSEFHFGGSERGVRVRRLLCLLVVLTFLHNPFLGAASLAPYPLVSHPPSFRATVASSELLKFSPKDEREVPDVQICEVALVSAVSSPDVPAFTNLQFAEAPRLLQNAPAGNLWFRPPPVA